jgi:hypothetical protein
MLTPETIIVAINNTNRWAGWTRTSTINSDQNQSNGSQVTRCHSIKLNFEFVAKTARHSGENIYIERR